MRKEPADGSGAVAERRGTVWMRPERGSRGPAAGRTRAELTAAAVALADREGLAAVSMRRVAKELGTGQASLYRYVTGREDLLDLMADAVAGEIDLNVPLEGDPVRDLVALAVRTKAAHLRHPWLADIPPEPLRLGPRGLDHLEYALRAMAPVPLPGRARVETVALLNALTARFAQAEYHDSRTPTGRRAAQSAYLASAAAAGTHPLVAAALAGPEETSPERAGTEGASPEGTDGGGEGVRPEGNGPGGEPDDPFARMAGRLLRGLLTSGSGPGPRDAR